MPEIVDLTPPVRYSIAEREAARLRLGKSRFFLLLGLGASLGSEENPLPPTIATCTKPAAVLMVVTLPKNEKFSVGSENARVLIELKERQSPKSLVASANRVLSAIGALFSHVHHTTYNDLSLCQVPKELIEGNKVDVKRLEQLEACTGRDPFNNIRVRLGSFVSIAESPTATIFYLLPFVLQNEDLFNACSFFRSCCSDFSFMDGVVHEVLYEPKREPENEIERLSLENVVLQSFRTVEALVGEPGNNVKRFRERLRAWGIKHNERVGFPGRSSHRLEDRIRWLQDARDSAAAHGRRRWHKPFTLFEAMEAQHIADAVLQRALWWTAASLGRGGVESEVAFLLEAMYPNFPGWSRDKKLFRGKRAVDLARTPRGLVQVLKYRERQVRAVLGSR